MQTRYEGVKELIAHAATHETISPLETMFDVVALLPWDEGVKDELNVMIFNLIKQHPAY